MPKLIEEHDIRITWDDITTRVVHKKKSHGRSAGVHLMSGVLKPVLLAGKLMKTFEELADAEEMPLRMAVGMAWEDWAVGLWPGMTWQPGECSKDGVVGSPDGVSKKPVRMLEEFKATWKSKRNYGQDILRNIPWIWQMQGYCHMLGLTRARLHVLWVNGGYAPPSPEYRTYLIEFTKPELSAFWANIVVPNLPGAPEELGQ